MKARPLFALFFASLAFDLYSVGLHPTWTMAPAALVGWYIADLLSGAVHLCMDYRPCRPGVGLKELYFWDGSRDSEAFMTLQAQVYARISPFERIVYDFKKHHPMPDLLGRHGLFHLMRAPVFYVTLPLSLVLSLAFAIWAAPGWLIVGTVVLLLGVSMSQFFHGSLHRMDNGKVVRAMRRMGLLMKPQAHDLHHATLRRDYGVISGWSNPLVNLLAEDLRRRNLLDEAGLTPT